MSAYFCERDRSFRRIVTAAQRQVLCVIVSMCPPFLRGHDLPALADEIEFGWVGGFFCLIGNELQSVEFGELDGARLIPLQSINGDEANAGQSAG